MTTLADLTSVYRATLAVLADRERELLDAKGPCSNPTCPLHHAHSGPCAPGSDCRPGSSPATRGEELGRSTCGVCGGTITWDPDEPTQQQPRWRHDDQVASYRVGAHHAAPATHDELPGLARLLVDAVEAMLTTTDASPLHHRWLRDRAEQAAWEVREHLIANPPKCPRCDGIQACGHCGTKL